MIPAALAHPLLLARTVRHLRPAQVAHRLRLRTQRTVAGHLPPPLVARVGRTAGDAPGWPSSFEPLDGRWHEGYPSPRVNAEGRFLFLGDELDVGDRWAPEGASRLWRFHLHYFEWAWSFAADPDARWARDAFAELWRSWTPSTRFGRGDAWSPYVVSLRAWALCGVHPSLVAGTPVDADVAAHLRLATAFLRRSLERDVGGNHLVKNLKALVGLGVFLGDAGLVRRSSGRLAEQIRVQVLADGGHYERSPSYHCQVLGDLIDVAGLLHSAGLPPVDGLAAAVEGMRRWLGAMLLPDGDVPLFNDCTLVGKERMALLGPAPRPPERLVVLQPSGYVVMRPGPRLHLVADVGPPCPPDLPAHAHADCLSFELAVDGARTIVDTGTSTYAPGERRAYERSTRAHNTVDIDGADQSEVWGTFRVARRARPTLHRAVDDGGAIEVTASHDGYTRLPGRPVHTRTWTATPGRVSILDRVDGTGTHRVAAHLHLDGPVSEERVPEGVVESAAVTISCTGPTGGAVRVTSCELAEGFGPCRPGHAQEASVTGPLPIAIFTRVQVRRPVEGGPQPQSTLADTVEIRR
jgi:uncharacterized heparinase superfamily protein